jgi:hypothetical protein
MVGEVSAGGNGECDVECDVCSMYVLVLIVVQICLVEAVWWSCITDCVFSSG